MRTWKDYKNHVKSVDEFSKIEMENIERMASIIGSIIEQRNCMGLSQRELASLCEIPQSTLARIETFTTSPNLDTLLKIMQPLGLTLVVSAVSSNV